MLHWQADYYERSGTLLIAHEGLLGRRGSDTELDGTVIDGFLQGREVETSDKPE